MRTSALKRLALVGAGSVLLAVPAVAQERPPREKADESTTIYVPYKDLDEIFDREKGGVFLPYKELQKLIERASQRPHTPETGPTPPSPYVMVGARYVGVADERVARFNTVLDIEVLQPKGYVTVPLGLPDVALENAKASDGKRAVLRASGADYELVAQGAGAVQITAGFAVKVAEDLGKRSFTFRLPRAATATFQIDLPERDPPMQIDGVLAWSKSFPEEGKTRVTAFLGATDKVTVTWSPQPKASVDSTARKALVFAETTTSVKLGDGVARSKTQIDFKVNQAPVDTFRVAFPRDCNVVKCPVDYEQEKNPPAGLTVIRITLPAKIKDTWRLELELERTVPEDAKEFVCPRIVTLDTDRENGTVAVASSQLLKLEPKTFVGLTQIDAKDLPAEARALAGADRPPLGFRYLNRDYNLTLAVSKIEPEVEGTVHQLATVRDEEVALVANLQLRIQKRGIFKVRLLIPQDLTNLDWNEGVVKDCRPSERPSTKPGFTAYDLEFPSQVIGETHVRLTGQVRRGPSARADGGASLPLPLIVLDEVKKEGGIVAVACQEHLKVLGLKADGLTPLSVQELAVNRFAHRPGAGEETRLAWKYTRITDAKREPRNVATTLDVSKREPKVSVRVETTANAQEAVVNVNSDLIYKIEYAGVDTFRLRVPRDLALERKDEGKVLNITDADGRESFTRALVREVTADGATKWEPYPNEEFEKSKDTFGVIELKLDKKVSPGEFRLKLSYLIKLEGLQAGRERTVALHDIVPVLAAGAIETGEIALAKHENLVISPQDEVNLETRDVRELPESLRREKNVFRGYRYQQHPVTLSLKIIKYDFQAPLGMIVNHLHLEEVVAKDGTIEVEAWIRLQNSQAQLIRIALPAEAEVKALRVNERNVPWSRQGMADKPGEPRIIVANLAEERVKNDKPVPFPIRVRYQLKVTALSGTGKVALPAPSFPLGEVDGKKVDVPVALFTRNVYLPDAFAYLDFDTDMTPHFARRSCWESLKSAVFTQLREHEGDANAREEIRRTLSFGSRDVDPSGVYPRLELPSTDPKLLSKIDANARLSIRYMAWPLFYVIDIVALVAIVAIGIVLERRGVVKPVIFVPVAAGAMLLLAAFGGPALEPFFESALVGSVAVGVFWLGRGFWNEITVERHKRRLEVLAAEAQVAKARASALEAEATGRAAPSEPTPPFDTKAPIDAGDREAAAGIALASDERREKKVSTDTAEVPPPGEVAKIVGEEPPAPAPGPETK